MHAMQDKEYTDEGYESDSTRNVDTAKLTAEGAADAIIRYLKDKGRLSKA